MTTIPLIALQSFQFEGRTVRSGEAIDVSPVQALALTYQRKARFLREGEAARKKRTYRRRDLTAEE